MDINAMRAALLARYDTSGRSLPWRIRPEERVAGKTADPYAVWLSEIMCQQTTTSHAAPYWHKFLKAFPTVTHMADAPRDEVLTLWAGLGYYARARNLHKCAQMVARNYGGVFPQTEAGLLALPGIGAYSAAAITAICYNEPTNVVDANVERVISRIFAVEQPLPAARKAIKALAATLADPNRPGDYAQALMDHGSQICKPRNPDCEQCVWAAPCKARALGEPERYPRKLKKPKVRTRYGAAFVLRRSDEILLNRRPDKGLLGGMMEFPGTEWSEDAATKEHWISAAPAKRNWQEAGTITHVFTHFRLELTVFTAMVKAIDDDPKHIWAQIDALENYALPSVMIKVAKVAGL
jgi:A/G-specific adenine glycosylase